LFLGASEKKELNLAGYGFKATEEPVAAPGLMTRLRKLLRATSAQNGRGAQMNQGAAVLVPTK
jgi:hypothetical protein